MRKIIFSIIVVVILGLFGQAAAASGSIRWAPNSLAVMPELRDAVERALLAWDDLPQCDDCFYAVTNVTQNGEIYAVSVAAISGADPEHLTIDNAVWLGIVTVFHQPTGGWIGSVDQFPDRGSGSNQVNADGSVNGPIFPWETGKKVVYGIAGVHNAWAALPNWVAVDFVSLDGGDMAKNMAYASEAGNVNYVCNDGVSSAIRINNIIYVHLQPDNSIGKGMYYAQGAPIWPMVTGTFSGPTCGAGENLESHWHLHFGFPKPSNGIFHIENWTLNTDTGEWTGPGGQTVNTGGYLTANWVGVPGDPITTPLPPGATPGVTATPGAGGTGSTGGAKNFWGTFLDGVTTFLSLIVYGNAPTHNQIGLAATLTNSTSSTLGVIFVLFISQFRPLFPLTLVFIVLSMESVRIILSLWMWFKKIVPFMR